MPDSVAAAARAQGNAVPDAALSAALLAILTRQRDRLPLESFCRMAGWPDEDSIELAVQSLHRQGDAVSARVSVRFTERVSTGCSTSRNNANAGGELAVHWVPASGACAIEAAQAGSATPAAD